MCVCHVRVLQELEERFCHHWYLKRLRLVRHAHAHAHALCVSSYTHLIMSHVRMFDVHIVLMRVHLLS